MKYKKTSIIILAYKEPEKFKKMFETLLATTHQTETPYEIIIVNNSNLKEFQFHKNHSPMSFVDKMQRKAFENGTNCHIFETGGENLGTSKGFNTGVQVTKVVKDGHYLCFFNSDYYMMENWLKSMIDCFEHQPNIGLCSCCTNATGNEDEKTWLDRKGDKYILCSENDYKESDCAIAQMFTTKKIWEEVDGFSEEFFPVTFEDLDFNEKIKEKGYKIFVNRKCFGYHDYGMDKVEGRKEIMDRNRVVFKKKWGNKFKWA